MVCDTWTVLLLFVSCSVIFGSFQMDVPSGCGSPNCQNPSCLEHLDLSVFFLREEKVVKTAEEILCCTYVPTYSEKTCLRRSRCIVCSTWIYLTLVCTYLGTYVNW